MSQHAMVPVRPTKPPVPSISIRTTPVTPPRDLLVPAIVYVSLALAVYVVVRGDTAKIALMLPYLAGVLQMLLRRPTGSP